LSSLKSITTDSSEVGTDDGFVGFFVDVTEEEATSELGTIGECFDSVFD